MVRVLQGSHFVSGEQLVRGDNRKFDSKSLEVNEELIDENGRLTKGPFTLKNNAVYTG
jgi:hypothetical protein